VNNGVEMKMTPQSDVRRKPHVVERKFAFARRQAVSFAQMPSECEMRQNYSVCAKLPLALNVCVLKPVRTMVLLRLLVPQRGQVSRQQEVLLQWLDQVAYSNNVMAPSNIGVMDH
jgi:hypothetical protein